MKKILFLFIIQLYAGLLFGQVRENTPFPDFSMAYYGNNLWNPGLKFGTEYIWKERVKTKEKKKRTKTKTNRFVFNGDAGFYWDPMNYTALFLYSGIRFRHINTQGFHYHFGASPVAYYRSFLTETYEVSSSGDVEKVPLPGRSYYAPTLTLGMGKYRKGERRLKGWFLDLDVMFLVPYNADFVPLLNLAYGYRFNL